MNRTLNFNSLFYVQQKSFFRIAISGLCKFANKEKGLVEAERKG